VRGPSPEGRGWLRDQAVEALQRAGEVLLHGVIADSARLARVDDHRVHAHLEVTRGPRRRLSRERGPLGTVGQLGDILGQLAGRMSCLVL
jgi:hypothetical protein